ncbi:hypothetical protein GMORB2_0202 [Geosmithia morbida]|uniref:Uncharacterized protein n=1 Tax=Geosmithia morbida TaxID=1094350 RepID=A0A9P5D7B6_9HYPO|nr:uncharacterized protein GMORB2_0202 [Geosmithia morbida]KAF4126466.1 hypothetical protein GMORB2_0202 [Geosmithia morbida]
MGRKPNPLILEYFVRGPKLNDNSNRYPHTCKQCGENFPKGRIDSLTTHITKKCPAISDPDRMRACLELHGITNARAAAAAAGGGPDRNGLQSATSRQVQNLPQGWSALETLAEASRQVDLNENSRGGPKASSPSHELPSPTSPTLVNGGDPANADFNADRLEMQEQFTLDNPPGSYYGRVRNGRKGEDHRPTMAIHETPPPAGLTPEERLQALLPGSTSSPDASNISVAVAATARLNPSFLDPQLVEEDTPMHEATPTPAEEPQVVDTAPTADSTMHTHTPTPTPTPAPAPTPTPGPELSPVVASQQPWGEMTYLAEAPTPNPIMTEAPPIAPMPMSRGGIRMDTSDGSINGRPRHSRARFTPARRKEVQEVRKIGACIRCRILRKNCGRGDPCDTCRKVLSPRVWRTGCVRTRLHEQLDLYSAGVQVVLSQNRINLLKEQMRPFNDGTTIQVTHFPDTDMYISAPTLVAMLEPSEAQAAARDSKEPFHQVIMIDQEAKDIPDKIEQYMRAALPLLVEREVSNFMRVTLQAARQRLADNEGGSGESGDGLLEKALELWGLVEIIDRERQWTFLEKPGAEGEEPRLIRESSQGGGNDTDIYTMICMQLNAAAERKANNTSKALLSLMHRLLQDSKARIDFNMFLTALIFLNCVEKSTWAFKAWEQQHLRPGWPLERDPSAFTQQGANLAGLLRMLLGIRKAMPHTARSDKGKLIATDDNPEIVAFFNSLDLDYDAVVSQQRDTQFSPLDSRSLELTFCSSLLLPN